MRFSLLHLQQLPRPWDDDAEQRALAEALEQVQRADALGYHAVWAPEHHFLEEHAHGSAPAVFLGACSQRTETIRLGLGALPLPPGYQHPARVAEVAATLDLLSGGRVELATTETATGAELGGFGVDRGTRRAQWDEALRAVARMLDETPFAGGDGPALRMPARNVVPKPHQRPHPPLWVAGTRRETLSLAAERGLGALSFAFADPEDLAGPVSYYYDTIMSERCVAAGLAVNANVAVVLPMMVHADEDEAIERGIDGAQFLAYSLAHYTAFGEHRPGQTSVWDEFVARREDAGYSRIAVTAEHAPLAVKFLNNGRGSLRGAVGTPDQLVELLRRYEEAGVDEVVLAVQTGRTAHAHVLEALELFATAVLPQFAARDGECEAAKRERLGDAARRALGRRPVPPAADPGYAFRAGDGGPVAPDPATPPSEPVPDSAALAPAPTPAARLLSSLEARGEQAFQAFVARAGDRRLEQVVGSRAGLRAVFATMERLYVPERAGDFSGDIRYELRARDGSVRTWTVTVGPEGATARAGAAPDPQLTVKTTVADFARIAARDLDPVKALLTGRVDLEGDFAVAARLGEMFGQPGAL